MAEQLLSLRLSISENSHAQESDAVFRALQAIDGLVDAMAASWQRTQLFHERCWHRIPFHEKLTVTPLDESDGLPIDETHEAVGCDISLGGISFRHAVPLPHRLVAVTFDLPDGSAESLVTRLKWCRFGVDGSYRSGGVFLRTTETLAR